MVFWRSRHCGVDAELFRRRAAIGRDSRDKKTIASGVDARGHISRFEELASTTRLRQPHRLPLLGPIRRHVHQSRNSEPAGKSPIDRRLNDVGGKEGEGQSHPSRPLAHPFTCGDGFDAGGTGADDVVKPPARFRDGGQKFRSGFHSNWSRAVGLIVRRRDHLPFANGVQGMVSLSGA